MDSQNKENIGPLQFLAHLSERFNEWNLKGIDNEMSIKLNHQDYITILKEIEKYTNLVTPLYSSKFSVDIGNIRFIFYRD